MMSPRTVVETTKDVILSAINRNDFSFINEELCRKRLEWLDENAAPLENGSVVRQAYELLLVRKMAINPSEVPIVYEDETKITWRSYNWCPVLDACMELGLDTREVCRRGWEDSVQAFVEKIDPRLRFVRNYERIRPYCDFCEESIELVEK